MAESPGSAPTWRSSFPAMGTRIDIIGWGGDGMAIVNAVVGVVARHEDMWSVFRPSSEVSRLNDAVASTVGGGGASRCGADCAQGGPGLVVSEETDCLLRDALALTEATGGAFNPLIGPLVAAWDVKAMRAAYIAGAPLPPAPSERVVEAALRASSWGLLSRVGERRWAMGVPGESAGGVDAPSPSLDLGGIAKGHTADACRDLAVAMGARGVLVSVGTSSVSVFGTRADGSSWRAGLRDPHGGPTSVAGVVELPAGGLASLSTSGDNLGPLGGVRADPVVGRAAGSVSDPRVKHGVKHGVKHPRVVVEFSITTSLTRARVTPRMRVCDKLVSWLHRACWRRRCRRRSSSIRPSIFRTSRPAGPAKRVPLPRRGLWAWCVRGMGEVQARLGLVGARIARGWGARDGAQVVSPPGVM